MNTKKVKNKKIKVEPMTLIQFKSKLEGIQMFQTEDWVPSKEQWALIKEMIENIIDNNESNYHSNQIPQEIYKQPQQIYKQPQSYTPQISSTINNITPPPNIEPLVLPTQDGQTINTQKLIGKMKDDGTYDSAFA